MNANFNKAASAVIVGLGRTGFSCARYLHKRGWRVAVTDTRAEPPQLASLRARSILGLRCAWAALMRACSRMRCAWSPLRAYRSRSRSSPKRGVAALRSWATLSSLHARRMRRSRASPAPTAKARSRRSSGAWPSARPCACASAATWANRRSIYWMPRIAAWAPRPRSLYVLELSSFQLETTHSLDLAAAAVLNVSADHLDRYASVEAYAAAKARIFARCDTAVINLDDPLVVSDAAAWAAHAGLLAARNDRRRLRLGKRRRAVVADAPRRAAAGRRGHEVRRWPQCCECARSARLGRGARSAARGDAR